MKKSRKILVMVTHGIAEFDVLFPLFTQLRKHGFQEDINIVVTVKKIYRVYQAQEFYQRIAKEIGVEVTFCQMSNKFDVPKAYWTRNRYGYWLARRMLTVIGLYRRIRLWRQIKDAEILMHEITNQWASTRFLYSAFDRSRKTLISYHHGAGILAGSRVGGRIKRASDIIHLSFHQHNLQFLNENGFRNIVHIGYPQFYDEWQRTVQRVYELPKDIAIQHVLIISRVPDEQYLTHKDYEYLLVSAVDAVRQVYEGVKIVIKRHPREEPNEMGRLLSGKNVVLSDQPIAALLVNTSVAINIFGSAILWPLGCGIPAVEFFIERERFLELEKGGSLYRKLGIDSVSTKERLTEFLMQVKKEEYSVPAIIEEFGESDNLKGLRKILIP
jgi:hypothetical protein